MPLDNTTQARPGEQLLIDSNALRSDFEFELGAIDDSMFVAAIKTLNDREILVVALRLEGRRYREIADVLGVHESRPREIHSKAYRKIYKYLRYMPTEQKRQPTELPAEIQAMPIDTSGLSARLRNCLIIKNVYTIGDLAKLSMMDIKEISEMPNFGKKTVSHLRELIAEHGITLLGA